MTAIITPDFKNKILKDLQDDVKNTENQYFIGLGKPQPWNLNETPDTPQHSPLEMRNTMTNTTAIRKVINTSLMANRIDWVNGMTYVSYNDAYVRNAQGNWNDSRFYVMNNQNEVFLCLYQGSGTSINVPTFQETTNPIETPDGYIWKYLFTVGPLETKQFMSANYLPVRFVTPEDVLADENGIPNDAADAHLVKQYDVQNAAIPGQIIGYEIINGGTGYSIDPNTYPLVIINGDGTGAAAEITEVNASTGAIEEIRVVENSRSEILSTGVFELNMAFGQDYSYASVRLESDENAPVRPEGSTDAIIRPIFAADGGMGADPRNDLLCDALMFHTITNGAEYDDLIIDNDFRQITLYRNPVDYGATTVFDEDTGTPLKHLIVQTNTEFTNDNAIIGGTSGAMGWIVKIEPYEDPGNPGVSYHKIWYYQDINTGFDVFDVGESVTEFGAPGDGTLASIHDPEVDLAPADLLYIDNRAPIMRAENQEEDIKIIIRL